MGMGWRGACEGRDFREGFQEVWLGKGWFIYGWSLRKSAWVWRTLLLNILGFPGGSVGKEFACNAGDSLQLRRPGFNPWVGKIWRRKWQPTPLFLPGKSHGQKSLACYSPWCCKRAGHDLAAKKQQLMLRNSLLDITHAQSK